MGEMVIVQADVKKMALLMHDTDIAFTAYGITLFELIGIDAKVAEVFQLDDNGSYKKLKDAQKDVISFNLGECTIGFDFGTIWDI